MSGYKTLPKGISGFCVYHPYVLFDIDEIKYRVPSFSGAEWLCFPLKSVFWEL